MDVEPSCPPTSPGLAGTSVVPTPAVAPRAHDLDADIRVFLRGRSAPCPRCGYDLRDIQFAKCPECAEPLVLKLGSPRANFAWLIVAMVPGCFSGVAACFLAVPIVMTVGRSFPGGPGIPWPIIAADLFGFLSAASVVVMYRFRDRVMAKPTRWQAAFAGIMWLDHVVAFVLFLLAMYLIR